MSAQLAEKISQETMYGVTREEVIRSILLNANSKVITGQEPKSFSLTEPKLRGSLVDSDDIRVQVIHLPKFNSVPKMQHSPFFVLQEWEGVVTEVMDNTFIASLLDVTKKRYVEDEEAEFSIDDLTDDNKRQLKPGAVFRWIIGYRSIAGTKERSSKVVFRRMPEWTQRDLTLAKLKAREISASIDWK